MQRRVATLFDSSASNGAALDAGGVNGLLTENYKELEVIMVVTGLANASNSVSDTSEATAFTLLSPAGAAIGTSVALSLGYGTAPRVPRRTRVQVTTGGTGTCRLIVRGIQFG